MVNLWRTRWASCSSASSSERSCSSPAASSGSAAANAASAPGAAVSMTVPEASTKVSDDTVW